MKPVNLFFVAGIALFASAAMADSLPVKPGMWETITTMNNNMLGTQTRTTSECMKDSEIDPRKMMEGMAAQECDLQTEVDGNTMTYTMACNVEGGTMNGKGRITVDGDTATGKMDLTGNMGGMIMEMIVTSKGKRIGDC